MPQSRREVAHRRDSPDTTPIDNETVDDELFAAPVSDDESPQTADDRVRTRKRKRRVRIWVVVVVVLIGLIVAGGLAAKRIYDQAMGVRGHLEASITEVTEVQRAVLAGELDAASAASTRLSSETSAAVLGTHGRLWSFAEAVPIVGDNLTAVRTVAEVTDQLAINVIAPASSVSLDAFRPQAGRIDLDTLAGLTSVIDRVDVGVEDAISRLESINREGLMDQVSAGVAQLDDALTKIQPMITPVRNIVSVLPDALGASGPRDYLLMFQGTSEARSLGGNAAVFIVLHAEDGALSIAEQVTSQQFHNAPPESIVALDPQAEAIYGDKIGRYTADFTMVPDFPAAVSILQAWWQREGFHPFDAVLSVDPVALSYVLGATGPVTLPTGDVLSADNAVPLLLNEVYFRYEDPIEQNVFFAAAANSVFNLVTSGNFAPPAFMTALSRSADEGRLLYWSDVATEMELIANTRMSGVMPTDDSDQSVVGVYVNDNTGSKMSYYLDMAVSVCRATNGVDGQVTLASSVTAKEATRLPRYVSGKYFSPGDISTYVVLYGPTGSSLSHVELDGRPATVLGAGEHLGRPAVKVELFHHLQSSHVLSFAFETPTLGDALKVWHTPLTRATDVETSSTC